MRRRLRNDDIAFGKSVWVIGAVDSRPVLGESSRLRWPWRIVFAFEIILELRWLWEDSLERKRLRLPSGIDRNGHGQHFFEFNGNFGRQTAVLLLNQILFPVEAVQSVDSCDWNGPIGYTYTQRSGMGCSVRENWQPKKNTHATKKRIFAERCIFLSSSTDTLSGGCLVISHT